MAIGALLLAQLTVATVAPDTVRWREPIAVRVVVQTPGREAPRLLAPRLGGLSIASSFDETRLESRNGRYWVTLERRYDLRARRPGTYAIGEFEARVRAERVRSRAHRVVVLATGDTTPPAIVARAPIDPRAHVNFRALVLPETVYVGQQATYQVGVFLDDEVRLRLRRNPEFIPPESRAMLSYELRPRAVELPPRVERGVRYEVHAFERALFPLSPGRHTVPPAQLVYALPLSSSFFSRSESFTMRSDSLTIVAVEPPEAGRPDDFAGAVGRLEVRARVDSAGARVGDPLLVTVQVAGEGNVKLFPRPALRVPWGTTVPAGERVPIDSTSSLVRGAKEFDWIVTPAQEGDVELAPIRYPYFNPYTERYEIAVTAPDTILVAPGTLARADSAAARAEPVLPLRRTNEGPVLASPLSRREFWLAVALAPLLALASLLLARRRARPAPAAAAPAERLRALARARRASSGDVRRAFVGALARRAALGLEALTRDGELAHALRRAGVTAPTAARAESLLRELDAAAFAGRDAPSEAAARALDVYREIDREARRAAPRTSGALALALLACLTMPGAQALAQDGGARFAAGVAAYDAGRYAEARDAFAAASRDDRRSPDAWANLGTASWAAGDTVGAVAAWQRALRLDPLDGELRERLGRVPGALGGPVSRVPPVPPAPAAILALALWFAGWLLLGWRALRGPRWTVGAGAGVVAAAALLLVVAIAAERRRGTDRLAVVSAPAAVHALAALVSDSVGSVGTGEVAQIAEERGAWARVRLDDGRAGWVERARLVRLDR